MCRKHASVKKPGHPFTSSVQSQFIAGDFFRNTVTRVGKVTYQRRKRKAPQVQVEISSLEIPGSVSFPFQTRKGPLGITVSSMQFPDSREGSFFSVTSRKTMPLLLQKYIFSYKMYFLFKTIIINEQKCTLDRKETWKDFHPSPFVSLRHLV